MTCGMRRGPIFYQVRCGDGQRRHDELFPSRSAATHWLTWDHFCYHEPHRVLKVSVPVPESTAAALHPCNPQPDKQRTTAVDPKALSAAPEPTRAVGTSSLLSSDEDDATGAFRLDPWAAWGDHPGVPVHVLALVSRVRAARGGAGDRGEVASTRVAPNEKVAAL